MSNTNQNRVVRDQFGEEVLAGAAELGEAGAEGGEVAGEAAEGAEGAEGGGGGGQGEEKKQEEKHQLPDPVGMAIGGWEVGHDPVWTGDDETTAQPLTARPEGSGLVGQSGPNQPAAREVGIEPAKSPAQSAIPEYRAPSSRLPEVITARQVQADSPDGCSDGVRR